MDNKLSQIVNLSKTLIRIPSTKEHPELFDKTLSVVKGELADFESKKFVATNSRGQEIPSLVFYNHIPEDGRFRILLHAHLDVVTPLGESQFEPRVENDKLFGRGSYDTKAAAAVLVHVFKDLAKKLTYPIGLSFTLDEEVGGLFGAKFQVDEGILADFVMSAEPTDFRIGYEHKGLMSIELKSKTEGGHSAYDGNEKNALEQVIRAQLSAQEIYPSPSKEWETSSAVTLLSTSNVSNNIVPGDSRGVLSVRYIAKDKPDEILKNIKNINKQLDVSELSTDPAHYSDPKSADIQLLSKAITEITGGVAEHTRLPHTSDVKYWSGAGAVAVDFGPSGKGMHSKNEYVDIDSLETYYQILKEFLLTVD